VANNAEAVIVLCAPSREEQVLASILNGTEADAKKYPGNVEAAWTVGVDGGRNSNEE